MIIGVILVCIILSLITVDRLKPSFLENSLGFIITPIQGLNTTISTKISDKIESSKAAKECVEENKRLKSELEKIKAENNKLEQLEIENKKLSSLLEIKSLHEELPTTGARIIAKNTGNYYNTFIIDKGSRDSLTKNMIVMSEKGVVGRISECGYNYSKVISIIDDTNAISVKCLRTDDCGYAYGDLSNPGMCKMEYIDNKAEIIEGDEIVTSHLSEIFPQGITVGYVDEIYVDTTSMTKVAIIEPAVDFKHLEAVLVVTEDYTKKYTESEEATTQE